MGRSRRMAVSHLGLTALLVMVAASLSCEGKKRPFTLTITDDQAMKVQGLVVSDVGTGARLGTTDADGTVSLILTRPKDSRLHLRLSSPEQDGRPLYLLEDESIEITDLDLENGFRVLRVERNDQTDSTATGTATYQVASDPPGAMVLINEEERGLTPVFLSDLPVGRIHVELRLEGYQPWDQTLLLTEAGTADTIALQKAVDVTASVRVDSSPKGAAILLDQRRTGEKTPTTLTGLKPGWHKVRLELAGHDPNETSVNLEAGRQATVKLQLQSVRIEEDEDSPDEPRRREKIAYSVSAKPWAIVYVDDDPTPRGETGSFTISLAPGLHRFRCVNNATGTDVTLSRELPPGDTSTILILDWMKRRITARAR